MRKYKMLIAVLLALAFVVSLHQYLNWGCWFEVEDIHHETLMISLSFAALILWFYIKWRRGVHGKV